MCVCVCVCVYYVVYYIYKESVCNISDRPLPALAGPRVIAWCLRGPRRRMPTGPSIFGTAGLACFGPCPIHAQKGLMLHLILAWT